MTRPLLTLKDVKKTFGAVDAVSGVTLDIFENEFFRPAGGVRQW